MRWGKKKGQQDAKADRQLSAITGKRGDRATWLSVRTQKGETYGIYSGFIVEWRRGAGAFQASLVRKNWMILWIILAIPTIGITLLFALWEWLKLRSIEQGVTNKRVILKRGIISRKTEEMKVASIETVEIIQGVMGRLFGYGDVKVTGRGISDVLFKKINDPMDVKRKIESV